MGAAWATDRTVIPLVFPNLSFDSIGWLYNVRKGLLLNDPDALDSIFDDITENILISHALTHGIGTKMSSFYSLII